MKLIHKRYLTTIGVIWGICFALFLIVYLALLSPQSRSIRKANRTLAGKKQDYEKAVKASLQETRTTLQEQIEQVHQRTGDFVIDFEKTAELTFAISQIAKDNQIDSFSIKNQKGLGLSEIPDCEQIVDNNIEVTLSADFSQFASFLNALERHRPVLFVDKFTIQNARQSMNKPEATINLVVLVRKPRES